MLQFFFSYYVSAWKTALTFSRIFGHKLCLFYFLNDRALIKKKKKDKILHKYMDLYDFSLVIKMYREIKKILSGFHNDSSNTYLKVIMEVAYLADI